MAVTRAVLAPLAAIGAVAFAGAQLSRRTRQIDFRERVVVISGGSRGLGLVLAREMATEGARLALLARDADTLERARQELAADGTAVLALSCDVGDQEAVAAAVQQIVDHYGQIDVLINNAGLIQAGPLEHMTNDDFAAGLATHFWGPLYLTQATLPHLRQREGARIINIASIGGQMAVPHLVPYSASKFALVGLSDGLRAELAKDGIRVTTVSPGLMRTGSPPNASFKGQQQAEYTWFALADALPITSIDARRAARQIVDACRYGDPQLIISWQAKVAILANALAPNLMAEVLALTNRLLPSPTGAEGDEARLGRESQSSLAPSVLTTLSDRATLENNEMAEAPGNYAH